MADKIKKQDVASLNDKNMKTMIIKLEDIKKENLRLKEKLLTPNKEEQAKHSGMMPKNDDVRQKTPNKDAENSVRFKTETSTREKVKKQEPKVTEETISEPLETPKPKLVSVASIGSNANDFDDIKRATVNRLKITTFEALGSKENEIKARYVKRIEEIKPSIDKFNNLIHKLKHDKYEKLVKNSASVFEKLEGLVAKKQEMFFKKMFLMHIDLVEDYDVYYNQLNNFQKLSSDFQKFNVR